MKQYAQGEITDIISVAANPIYPAYVIKGKNNNMMIDAGINLFGPLYLKSLQEILGDAENLDYLCLTHSHYDHLGAMPYLKRKLPNIKIGGSDRITDLLKKDTVLIRMGYLSDLQRELFKDIVGKEDVSIESVDLDLSLKEGDTIDLGDMTCHVYEVPGHTRDSLAYYIPEIDALFPGEAAGNPLALEGNEVHPEFLASYEDYVESLKKMIDLKPKLIGIGHGFVITGDEAEQFLDDSLNATYEYKKLIEHYLEQVRGNIDRAIELIVQREYDEKGKIKQERNSYVINLTAQVKEIVRLNKANVVNAS